MYDLTVIIPTFNEAVNIHNILTAIDTILRQNAIKGQLLVVDDNSPDGTSGVVQGLMHGPTRINNLSLILRKDTPGLSASVVEGLNYATSPVCIVIDSDFSHPPELIPRMYADINQGYDIVIGSRYMVGGGIRKWPLQRRVISCGATLLGRLLFPDITDPVSGFFAIRRSVIVNAPLEPMGYKILLEILGRGRWSKVKEIPYEFVNREAGSSKLSFSVIIEYVQQVTSLVHDALVLRTGPIWVEMQKVLKFCLVGTSGIYVNLGVLLGLVELSLCPEHIASMLAIEVSILTNFAGNDIWTFSGQNTTDQSVLGTVRRLGYFNLVSLGGAIINYAIFLLLTTVFSIYYIFAQLIGILLTFIWNFIANRRLTWGRKLNNK